MSINADAYRLVKPGEFEFTTITHEFNDGDVIVNPKKQVCVTQIYVITQVIVVKKR